MKTRTDKDIEAREEAIKAAATDPFESLAEPTPAQEPIVKKAAEKKSVAKKAVKRAPVKARSVDAFDAPAKVDNELGAEKASSSPAKKAPAEAKRTTKVVAAKKVKKAKTGIDVTSELAAKMPEIEVSPVFKALAEPALPVLEHDNRARLLMQSPTKLYFYWSVKENPYHLLREAFGSDTGSYTLVLKLTDLKHDSERILPADAEGGNWFDVEPDGEYQAEIGFYAPNRPYFRIIYSNKVVTPRRSPSLRVAAETDWTVSANEFAEVLDVSGFARDAFDVAMIGDDPAAAEQATQMAFSAFAGTEPGQSAKISAEDLRHAMYAFASGQRLEDLRSKIGSELFSMLEGSAGNLNSQAAASALNEYFGSEDVDITEEDFGSAVFGASMLNFPRKLKTGRSAGRYAPVSSPGVRP